MFIAAWNKVVVCVFTSGKKWEGDFLLSVHFNVSMKRRRIVIVCKDEQRWKSEIGAVPGHTIHRFPVVF